MTLRSVVKGTGSALPERRVDNAELAREVDTSDEWIVERTGIRSRYVAADGETTATLAVEACRKALEAAGLEANDIGLIVLATATPDQTSRPRRPRCRRCSASTIASPSTCMPSAPASSMP